MKVTGTFLFYARGVDGTMLTVLSFIALKKSAPIERKMNKYKQFLEYAATQPESILLYLSSVIVLAIHSNGTYLNATKSRSRVGGHHYISRKFEFPTQQYCGPKYLQNHKIIRSISC